MDSEYDRRNLWLEDTSGARSKRRGERGDGTLRKLRDDDRTFVRLYIGTEVSEDLTTRALNRVSISQQCSNGH